jgi:hypothetical protein
MNYYHMWFNLRPQVRPNEFCKAVDAYLGYLKSRDLNAGWRLTRRKFGFGPAALGEYHVAVEVRDLTQLDAAFGRVAQRDAEVETLHRPVYTAVTDFQSALYRDYPDWGPNATM